MNTDRQITIRLNTSLAAAAAWAVSVGLLAWDSFASQSGDVGRWALLVSIAAGCLTVACLLKHHRRVMLEVISYEFRMRFDDDGMPVQREGPRAVGNRNRSRISPD